MIRYTTLGLASNVEHVLKSPVLKPEVYGLHTETFETLSELGCPFALALQSGWTIRSTTSFHNLYATGFGRGKRIYISEITMDVPSEIERGFVFSFHAELLVDFAAKDAVLTTSTYRFNCKPYKFAAHHKYEPSIHDYMYACGCSSQSLNQFVNANEAILPLIRLSWFKQFAPSQVER